MVVDDSPAFLCASEDQREPSMRFITGALQMPATEN
jgi:hypothetical protein